MVTLLCMSQGDGLFLINFLFFFPFLARIAILAVFFKWIYHLLLCKNNIHESFISWICR